MRLAIAAAREGLAANDGGPFGACVARDGQPLAVAHNTVLRDRDPTAHAEINAIREACRRLGAFHLDGCVLYATAEPCPMCLSAGYWARVSRVVIGVSMEETLRFGFQDTAIRQRCQAVWTGAPHDGHCLADECRALFDEWRRLGRPLY